MKNLLRLITTCILVLVSLSLYSQVSNELTGYVVDSETGMPVPYASVGIPELQRGISANMNGYFKLLVPAINPAHHLQVSSIGYEGLRLSLSEIELNTELQIKLNPQTKVLEEIVIIGKSQTVEELVKRTSKNRKDYLRRKPYLMNGFYRELLTVQDTIQGITEAQGILYMNGYNSSYKNNNQHLSYDLMQWKNMRRSDYPETGQPYLEIAALLKAKDYYLHDGPLHKQNLNKLEYQVSDSTTYGDHLVLEVSFKPMQAYHNTIPYSGKMLIKEDDAALLSLEIEAQGAEPFLKQNDDQEDIKSLFRLSFSLFEGDYYMSTTSYSRSYSNQDASLQWSAKLFGLDFANQNAMFLNYNQRAVLYSEMLNPLVNYDPDFWSSFSYAENDETVDVTSENPELEEQFQSHDAQRLVPLPDGFENYEQMENDRSALDFIMQR